MKDTILHWTGVLLSIGALVLAGCAGSDLGAQDDARSGPASAADLAAHTFAHRAAGTLRASMAEGRPTIYCPYQVEREGDGGAVVTVTKPDRSLLVFRFSQGEATSVSAGDPSQAATFSSSKQGGLNIVQVGGERYGIPDYVIYGN